MRRRHNGYACSQAEHSNRRVQGSRFSRPATISQCRACHPDGFVSVRVMTPPAARTAKLVLEDVALGREDFRPGVVVSTRR